MVNYLTNNFSSPQQVKGARQSATYKGVDSHWSLGLRLSLHTEKGLKAMQHTVQQKAAMPG